MGGPAMSVADPIPGPPAPQQEPGEVRLGAGFDFTDPRSPLAPWYLGTAQVLAVLILCLLFVLLTAVPLWHTDVWGHLAWGRWALEQGRLPSAGRLAPLEDPASDFRDTYWLCQVGLQVVFRLGEILAGGDDLRRLAGGVEMLCALHALLVVLRFALLLLAFQRLGGSWPAALAGLLAVLVLSLGHLAVFRPQVLGEAFFAAVLL